MTTARVTAPEGWSASGRMTASGATGVLIRNTDAQPIYWAVTADDTAPDFDVALGHPVAPGEQFSVTLADGERFWYGARRGQAEITLTDGADT